MSQKNKIITKIIVILGFLTITMMPFSVQAFFSDVPTSHPQFKAIKTLELEKLINGYKDNTFKPEKLITKSEFLKIVFNDVGFKPSTEPTQPVVKKYNTGFKDVQESSWYAPYIKKALELNIISKPDSSENFYPNKGISKLDAIKIAFPLEGIPTPYYTDIDPNDLFKDVKKDAWFTYLALAAKKNDIVFSKNPDLFLPFKNLTRGDAAELIYKIQLAKEGKIGGTIGLSPAEQTFNGLNAISAQFINNPKFPILLDVWERANKDFYYKENVNQNDLVYGAIEGMTEKLKDRYTIFQEPLSAQELTDSLAGEFEGIGLTLDVIDNKLVITSPLPNSPAEKAGLKGGDTISKINQQEVANMTLEKILGMIKGKAGTSVHLTIIRNNQTMEFDITREKISLPFISGKIINGNIAYINIQEFLGTTDKDFTKISSELLKSNPKGFIIDLRGNPGGYLDSAVSILGHFIAPGKVEVSTKSTTGTKEMYISTGPNDLSKYPVVILINGNTASAAEIMAGALQDYKIAKIVGEKSFGKGSVQELIKYQDRSMLKISVAHWFTPLGKDINGIGIIPDIAATKTKDDIKAGKDPQLDKAVATLQNS